MSAVQLFEPRREDGRAEWRVVFDLVKDLGPGEVVTYECIREELAVDDDAPGRGRVYRAAARANKELRKLRSRSLGVVRGEGYRILHAYEHEHQAEGYREQGMRRMETALDVLHATNLAELDEIQRRRSMAATMVLSDLVAHVKHQSERQRKQEEALHALDGRISALEQQRGREGKSLAGQRKEQTGSD